MMENQIHIVSMLNIIAQSTFNAQFIISRKAFYFIASALGHSNFYCPPACLLFCPQGRKGEGSFHNGRHKFSVSVNTQKSGNSNLGEGAGGERGVSI